MADISRIASPMSICEEDLFDVSKKVDKKKKELLQLQKIRPASFLVGSIDKVNERICNLDSELSLYDSKLAIECRSSHNDDIYNPTSGTFHRKTSAKQSTRSAKAREEKENKKFAGVFAHESDLQPEVKIHRKKVTAKKSDAPQLVELQQYPGFVSSRLTPLPHSLEATVVLDHVLAAQRDLRRKPVYKQEFINMLYSKTQRAIIQDSFWWFFLNKYHPDPANQSKLFKRISQNFVTFLLMAKDPKFRDTFFMVYANVLAQSIYSAFCVAFPQSWRQFDDPRFKETLLSTTTVWISGIRPPPRLYERWNYVNLEPSGMRKEESIKNKKSSEKTEKRSSAAGKISPSGSVASTKTSTVHSRAGSNKGLLRTLGGRSDVPSSVSSQKTKSNEITDRNVLSPITEVPADEGAGLTKASSKRSRGNSSCASGRSVEFDRCVFNIHGGSPLLSEYMNQRGLGRKTGCDHLVRRTQIDSYPSHDAHTFDDVINESANDVRKTVAEFNRIHLNNEKSSNDFVNKQTEANRVFSIKADKILSKPRQVRYLSNLFLMEMKRDPEEVTLIGASAALQNAFAAESAN